MYFKTVAPYFVGLAVLLAVSCYSAFNFDTGIRITQYDVSDRHYAVSEYHTDEAISLFWKEQSALLATLSRDDGFSWSPPEKINDEFGDVFEEYDSALRDDGMLATVWRNIFGDKVFFSMSSDKGSTWSPNIQVNYEAAHTLSDVTIVPGDHRLIAVWIEQQTAESYPLIFSSFSTDSGENWSYPPVRVDDFDHPALRFDLNALTLSDGRQLCVWADDRGDLQMSLWSSVSIDGGITWSSNIQITHSLQGDSRHPTLLEDHQNNLYAGFIHFTGYQESDVRICRSSDGGTFWELINEPLNDSYTLLARSPKMRVTSTGKLTVTWADDRRYRESTIDGLDVFLTCSSDSGTSWLHPNIRINRNSVGANQFYFNNDLIALANGDVLSIYKYRSSYDHYYSSRGHALPEPTATSMPGEPTYTPVPSTWTPTPTPTRSPQIWPTITPSPTNPPPFSPTPSPSATPACDTLEIYLDLNQTMFHKGDPFLLRCGWCSTGDVYHLDQYILLDVSGEFWFWPSWGMDVDADPVTLTGPVQTWQTILDFEWPEVEGSIYGIFFWAAFLHAGTSDLACDYDVVEWGYE